MKKIRIELKIEGDNIASSVTHKGDITLNEFFNIVDRFEKTVLLTAQQHCKKNNINIKEYASNTTLTEFYKLLNK
jgi:hypothetical protein